MVVRYRSELPVPTVAHLHGGHTSADSDGWRSTSCCRSATPPGGRGTVWSATSRRGSASTATRPAEVVEVAVRFTEHAGRYVLHCHNLEHEDMP